MLSRAIHSVDPLTDVGLMAPGAECDQYQVRDMKKLFSGKLPFTLDGAVSVAPFWFCGDNGDGVLFLYNFGYDTQNLNISVSGKRLSLSLEPLSIKEIIM